MDEPTPSLEVSTTSQGDSLFSLSKEDISRQCLSYLLVGSPLIHDRPVFMNALEQIERSTVPPAVTSANSTLDDARSPSALAQDIPHPLKETRAALEKLISRIEGLSAEFDRLMERSGIHPSCHNQFDVTDHFCSVVH